MNIKTPEKPCPCADMSTYRLDAWDHALVRCLLTDRDCPLAPFDPTACGEVCPLPGYSAEDPVTRLRDAGFADFLEDLARADVRCLGSCDPGERRSFACGECLRYGEDPDPATGSRIKGICPSTASELRLLYLGAEWRRRNSDLSRQKENVK